ncbi:MAG: thiamine pyrophosphate-dependent enzyme [Bacteroidia bacterium]
MEQNIAETEDGKIREQEFKTEVMNDYRIAFESRQASLIGRKEVLTGKAKFGIFGDGKEVAQLAMAKSFKKGDFRSGYYRDQTFMFATGMSTIREFFAQLYADTNLENDPASGGRQMNSHFATRSLDENGEWKNLTKQYNCSADISPTAGQMPRLVGLGYASKLYRENEALHYLDNFSHRGNEVAFGTIGNASTAEGLFWESVNAVGVLKVPVAISIWDDDYGISVPQKYQVTKQDLSEILNGFGYDEEKDQGFLLFRIKGWDYPALMEAYEEGIRTVREKHIPAIFHVVEVTQPQGHSTSGSHERYKSRERLEWEKEHDCMKKMREWLINTGIATEDEIQNLEEDAIQMVKDEQKAAWNDFINPIKEERNDLINRIKVAAAESENSAELSQIASELQNTFDNDRRVAMKAAFKSLLLLRENDSEEKDQIKDWRDKQIRIGRENYNTDLYSRTAKAAKNVIQIDPVYEAEPKKVDGREIMVSMFTAAMEQYPELFAIGEDVGKIGDVNQGMAGLQELFGEIRVTDTGIREATILGQGIGAAMRGLRPIVEIQYLDYLLYALQIISDDLATVSYRTRGGQKAPLIIRTRGHRLEGIWHSGSPMATILGSFRGINVCVPRNMTQAARFYNTILQSDEPALIVERLNAYRIKEDLPSNVGEMTLALGQPEILQEGDDITIVTYGACVDIAREAMEMLDKAGVSCELIDVQTLLPFDTSHSILESLKKTSRILFLDEDVPGGATAYMMQEVMETQGGYYYLDSKPITLSAKAHRPAYGTDGDYFSKPNSEGVFDAVYRLMNEVDPQKFALYF